MKTQSTIYASFLVCKDAGSSVVNLLKVDFKKENLKVLAIDSVALNYIFSEK